MRRILTILSTAALLATAVTPVGAVNDTPFQDEPAGNSRDAELELEEADATLVARGDRADARLKSADAGRFIVTFTAEPVATYEGGVPGLGRTKPRVERGEKLDVRSQNARAYRQHLSGERGNALGRIAAEIGRDVQVEYVYDVALNGFAAFFTPEEAIAVSNLDGVESVEPEEIFELHTDNGPAWIGAPSIWDGTASDVGTRGEGVIVGVIDTGINPSNPSFAGTGPVDGYEHTNPFGDGNYVGVCNPDEPAYDPTFPCNDKLIGAWDFLRAQDSPDNDARDYDGHGSHTASTAAGNVVDATVLSPATPGLSLQRQIGGVAPHANIIAYLGCCSSVGLAASIDQAVADGVDVINYSIGGGTQSPWSSSNAMAFLAAREAGVFVATSAGNAGPGAATVGTPGDAPWILTVGASTHDRNISNTLTGFTGGAAPLADIIGKGFTGGYGPADIVYAGDFGNALCGAGEAGSNTSPFPAGTFNGQIVVCDRGIYGRVEKGVNVLAGGAGGMILANDAGSAATLNSDAHVLPAVHISHADGVALKAWLADATTPQVTISGVDGVEEADSWGDKVAAFSSRGPNPQMDVITPSVSAPGLDIIAAVGIGDPDPAEWNIISGTSMASPHAAGAAALLVDLYPDWTPDQVQAALMTTSVTDLLKEDGVTPADWFDIGAGRIDLAAASQAGLVLDESIADYVAADPAEGGDPKTLNLPNLANSQCLGTCSWTRTVEATTAATWSISGTGPTGLNLSVSPTSATLAAGETLDVTITAEVGSAEVGEWLFGQVNFTSPDAPAAHFPVAVVPAAGVLPGLVTIDTRRDAGSQLVTGLQAKVSPELTVDVHGLSLATVHEVALNQDPTRGDPYTTLDEVWWTTVEASDAVRLVAEVIDTTAPDLDLFVGTGATPSAATEVCASTTPSSNEYCDIGDPASGTWWVLVQNWAGSTSQPDPISVAVGVVPASDEGTMTVEHPASVSEGEPFDVRVFWDADMEAGQRWYGAFSLGSSASNAGDIGRVPVNLVRHDDDVTKTSDVATAAPGDTVTYEIQVAPNVTPEDLAYTITDTIPEGMTYVEGSATGGATVTDGVVSWSGTMPTSFGALGNYVLSTNATDTTCRVPFGAGTWVDLGALGIAPIAGFDGGDSTSSRIFTAGSPFTYWGAQYTGLVAAPVGTAMFGEDLGTWWVPQALPNPGAPNALVGGLWGDFEWVYDPAAGTGFRAVTLGTTETGWAILDHDGMQLYGGSDESWSVQQWIRRSPAASGPSIVFAYNDLSPLTMPTTVGVEDAGGTKGTALVNNAPADGVIADDTIVCFTYEGPTFAPQVITYQVTVDDPILSGTLTNEAVHDTDNPGSKPAVASVDVEVSGSEAEIESISVSPASASLRRAGETQQFTATAHFAGGVTLDATDEATWTSANEVVVTIEGGLATAVSGGVAMITATYADLSGSAEVTVTARPAQPGPPPGRGSPPASPGPPGG